MLDTGQLIAVLSDGAGSAEMGGEGASLVTRAFSTRLRSHYRTSEFPPTDETIRSWIDEVRDAIAESARRRGLSTRDFASTLVCAVSDGSETIVAHIGDGCVVGKATDSNQWRSLTWPAHGEYASTTFFVTDDPEPRLVVHRHAEQISALVLFTDGLERLALDFGLSVPHARFFDGIAAPVFASTETRRDHKLSSALSLYLDSEAINARTDDDKTIVIAVQK